MSIDVMVIVLMAVGFVVFVGEPLVRRTMSHELANDKDPEVAQLSLQKETLYTAIRDLDFDFQTDKVDAADYRQLRRELEDEALQVLRSLDAVDPLVVLDDELERQILAFRQRQDAAAPAASPEACPGCGAALQGGEHFCPFCGHPIRPS